MSKDLNNDGFDDLVLQETSAISLWQGVWESNPSTPSTNWGWLPLSNPNGAKYVAIGDLSGLGEWAGDGSDDLIFQDSSLTWQGFFEFKDGFPFIYRPLPSTAGNKIVGAGDLNGDGEDDLLLQNPNSKDTLVWFRKPFASVSNSTGWNSHNTFLPNLYGSDIVAVGDYNGDGFEDIVSQASDNSWQAIWLNNGGGNWTGITLSTTHGADIVGSGDYNNDGIDDIVLQDRNYYSWQGVWLTDLSKPSTQWGWQDLSTTHGADILV